MAPSPTPETTREEDDSADETFFEVPSESLDESESPIVTPIPTTIPSSVPTENDSSVPTMSPSSVPDTAPPTLTETTLTPTPPETSAPSATPKVVRQDEDTTASYQFDGEVSEPTGREIFRLEVATTAFYIGVFAEAYMENPDTIFANVVARVQELRYTPEETSPIQIDWVFQVSFSADSAVIPTSEEVLDIIYADEETLDQYVDIYLQNGDDVWSSLTAVTYDEDAGSTPAPSLSSTVESTSAPSLSPFASSVAPSQTFIETTLAPSQSPMGLVEFPSTDMEATIMFQFSSNENGTATEPSQEEYDRLATATSVYFTLLLTEEYLGSNENTLATATATITDTLFTEGVDDPLQANFDFGIFFSTDSVVIPTPESIFEIFQDNEASLESFLQEFSWNEGDVWNEVTDVSVEPLTPIRRSGKRQKVLRELGKAPK